MDLKLDRVREQAKSDSYSIALDLDDRLFVLMSRDADRGIQGESLSMAYEGRALTLPVTSNVTNGITVSDVNVQVPEVSEEEVRKVLGYEGELPAYVMEMARGLTGQLSSVADRARRVTAKRILNIVARDLTDERRKLYLDSVRSASNAISSEMTELHDDIGYALGKIDVEKVRGKAEAIGRRYNLLTAGLLSRHLNRELDSLYERLLGWQLLNECVNPYADVVEADAQVLQRQSDGELAKRFEELSSFYRQLGTQAGYAERRMANLVNDYVKAWSLLGLVQERDDFTSIKDNLVVRINNP